MVNTLKTVPRQFRRKRVLILGCGEVGLRCAQKLIRFSTVAGTSRSANPLALRALGIRSLALNLDTPVAANRKRNIAALAPWVIYLAPPPNVGETDPRIKHFLAATFNTSHAGLKTKFNTKKQARLIYVSTSGVYGDCQGELFDETSPAAPKSARAIRRLNAEKQVRAAGKKSLHTSILRTPGIYASNRLPIERLQKGTPALVAEEDVYTNHIHADDLATICICALFHAKPNRIYHASDDSSLKMGDYFDAVAKAFNLPRAPRLSAKQLQTQVSPALWSFMSESRRLKNHRIKTELRVRLRYPTIHEGLAT